MDELTGAKTCKNKFDTINSFNRLVKSLLLAIVIITLLIIGLYFSQFNGEFGNQEVFAQFGDFVGGVINPVLGFATVVLLVASIRIQAMELRNTTEELALARKEMKIANGEAAKSADAMKRQTEHLERRDRIEESKAALQIHSAQITTLLSDPWHVRADMAKQFGHDGISTSEILNYSELMKDWKKLSNEQKDITLKFFEFLEYTYSWTPYSKFKRDLYFQVVRLGECLSQLIELGVSYHHCEYHVLEFYRTLRDMQMVQLITSEQFHTIISPIKDSESYRMNHDDNFTAIVMR